jgi:hypothetical protein
MTGANTAKQKQDRLEQWIKAPHDKHPYLGRAHTDVALEYRQRTGKTPGKKNTKCLMQELMKKDKDDRGCPTLTGMEKLRQ